MQQARPLPKVSAVIQKEVVGKQEYEVARMLLA